MKALGRTIGVFGLFVLVGIPLAATEKVRFHTAWIEPPRAAPGWDTSGVVEGASAGDTLAGAKARRAQSVAEEQGEAVSNERELMQQVPAEATCDETVVKTDGTDVPFVVGMNRILSDEELGVEGVDTEDLVTVVEPTVAGDRNLLISGNHFAGISVDDGRSFQAVDPNRFLRREEGEYCCDQVTAFDPDRALLVWLVQYERRPVGNRIRLVVSQGMDRIRGRFMEYDLTPQAFGWEDGTWFDFSDLVVGHDSLYLTTMAVGWRCPASQTSGMAIRLPLDALAQYQGFEAAAFSFPEVSLRAVRGGGDEMVIATHASYESLYLWRWPEGRVEPEGPVEVGVEPWSELDGSDSAWLRGADGVLLAGWAHGRELGFAWTAGRTDNDAYSRPHVRVAIIDRETLEVIAEPHLWSETLDFAYPSVAPSRSGTPGLSVHFAAADGRPGHAVGVLMQSCSMPPAQWRWELLEVARSETSPGDRRWGDYLSIRRDGVNPDGWLTSGYRLDETGRPRIHIVRFSPGR